MPDTTWTKSADDLKTRVADLLSYEPNGERGNAPHAGKIYAMLMQDLFIDGYTIDEVCSALNSAALLDKP